MNLSVCVSVRLHISLKYTPCACYRRLGPLPASLRYVMEDVYLHTVTRIGDAKNAYSQNDPPRGSTGPAAESDIRDCLVDWPVLSGAGGMDNIVLGTLRKYSTGFVGCLSNVTLAAVPAGSRGHDVTLAADYAIDLTGDADDGRNIRQCSRAPAGLRRRQRRHLDT